MEITIKPYSAEYAAKCANLLQFLWKEEAQQREEHFKWGYTDNPNTKNKPLAVIAVNEHDEVVGFRGYHTLKYNFGGQLAKLAYIADTVVSPKARRMGIFENMTKKSFEYLKDNGAACISNLGPSWPPYYGYKKLGFEDLCEFRSVYYVSLYRYISEKFHSADLVEHINEKKTAGEITYQVATSIPVEILEQIPSKSGNKIESVKDLDNLVWKGEHPGPRYVYAWAVDNSGTIKTFFWFKASSATIYNLGLHYMPDKSIAKKTFKFFTKITKPVAVAAWSFALEKEDIKKLSSIGMHKIPYINKIRKNPPVIVRTLISNSDGSLNWTINGTDIKKNKNWSINKFDGDSF